MRLYRVTYSHEGGTSKGYGWFSSYRVARAAVAEFRRATQHEDGDASVEPVEIPLTKAGVLAALNFWATYPDNG